MQSPLLSGTLKNEGSQERRSIRNTAFGLIAGLLPLVGYATWSSMPNFSTHSDEISLASTVDKLGEESVTLNDADLDETTLAKIRTDRLPVAHSEFRFARSQSIAPRAAFRVISSPLPTGRSLPISHAQQQVLSPPSGSLESTKASLLRLALLSGRGVWSRPPERDKAAALVEELERSSKTTPTLRDGVWELAVSDVEPFRASIFFLALAEAVEANLIKDASDGALTVHSLATGGGEIGRVAHIVEENASRLHSLVELKTGSVPSIPFALTGTVISSGELTRRVEQGDGMFSLDLKNTTVQGNKVRYGLPSEGGLKPGEEPNILSWIGDQLVPSGDIFDSVLNPLGGGQTSQLRLSYSDDEIMVWRTPQLGNHFFCFVRGEEDSWPAMAELKARQDKGTQSQSLIGSAFALGMLNPFFSRRAGVRAGPT